MDDTTIPQDTLDGLIAERLPGWMKGADPDPLRALHQALLAQQRAQRRLQETLGEVTAPDVFAEPLLRDALAAQHGLTLDVRVAYLRTAWLELVPPLVPSPPFTYIVHHNDRSLLAAALHNFSEYETTAEGFIPESMLFDDAGEGMSLRPEAFARLCRTLDIGGQYQRYLQARFAPAEATARSAVHQVLEESLRCTLDADCRMAQLKSELDERSVRLLLQLTAKRPLTPADSAVSIPRQLYLLGKRIRGVATLEVRQGATVQGVIAWIPGDPHGSLSRHASWEALYRLLGSRLRDVGYAAFFARFIGEADRAPFARSLARQREAEDDGPMELDGREQPVDASLITHLCHEHLGKIFADARTLAVSTDDEDRASRTARLEGYAEAGLGLLNLVGLFVPGLGQAMLGVAALQIAHEVYEGYEDWQLGDRESALEHLFGVAGNLAMTAALSAGGAALGRVLRRQPFVDGLLSVPVADGKLKLCDATLKHYRLKDEGVVGLLSGPEGQQQLRLDEGTYPLAAEPNTTVWRIRHPHRPGAYRPRLWHNGSGGWVHELECVDEWQGDALLMRRFGGDLAQVDATLARHLEEVCGLDGDRLRQLHLERAPAPARLSDALQRFRLREREPSLASTAFEQRLTTAQPQPGEGERILMRDFVGLTPRCAREILAAASSVDAERLRVSGRVPLAVAEQARWALRDARLDRACAGLGQDAAMTDDGERLALALADRLAPWASQVRLELREGAAEGRLLAEHGSTSATDIRRIVRTSRGYLAVGGDGRRLSLAKPGDTLPQALLLHMDATQSAPPGLPRWTVTTLSRQLLQRAAAERDSLPGLLGMAPLAGGVRPLARLGDGRLGFALSGVRLKGRRAVHHALRRIFPRLSERDAHTYIEQRLQEGGGLWRHISTLQLQLDQLERHLSNWRSGQVERNVRTARAAFARQLLEGWRSQSFNSSSWRVQLSIEGEPVGSLPSLPAQASFANVTHLSLRNLNLSELPADFLQGFPRLQSLDLRHNQLKVLPAGLEQLTDLQALDLSSNRLVLTREQSRRLSTLRTLRHLNLSRNPLVAPPALDSLVLLRVANLRDCGLAHAPTGLERLACLDHVDLRDNRIARFDPPFFSLPARTLQRVHLHDNPLDAVTTARLGAAREQALTQLSGHTSVANDTERDAWLALLDEDLRLSRQRQWDALVLEPGAADLFRLLNELRETEDFSRLPFELARRVWLVVDACEQNGELREQLFELLAHPRNCSDSAAFNFSLLEVQSWVHQQTAGLLGQAHERGLMRLGRALFRLDEVDAAAAEDIQQRLALYETYDEIEVRLAYRHGLADSLGLPGQPTHTRFSDLAEVSTRDLLRVRSQVLTAEATPRLAASLAQRDFWRAYLRQAYPERFTLFERPFAERLNQLDEEATQVTSGRYRADIEALAEQRDTAEQTLFQLLTEEAFTRNPL